MTNCNATKLLQRVLIESARSGVQLPQRQRYYRLSAAFKRAVGANDWTKPTRRAVWEAATRESGSVCGLLLTLAQEFPATDVHTPCGPAAVHVVEMQMLAALGGYKLKRSVVDKARRNLNRGDCDQGSFRPRFYSRTSAPEKFSEAACVFDTALTRVGAVGYGDPKNNGRVAFRLFSRQPIEVLALACEDHSELTSIGTIAATEGMHAAAAEAVRLGMPNVAAQLLESYLEFLAALQRESTEELATSFCSMRGVGADIAPRLHRLAA